MADKRIKGITIQIDGDTKKLNEALKDVNKQISTSNTELKELKNALKLDPKNTELLAQKQEVLKNNIKATTDRLNTLKEAQKQMGEYNSLTEEQKENYRALGVEITKTESNLKDLNKEFKESSKFSLDKLNDSLSGVRETSTKVIKNIVKIGTAIGGVLTALGVASIKSYAEYEQLVGGVETLFKGSADEIMKYAQNAYKTAGLSANEYMETVTSFSASLIQSLKGNTEKATKYADTAITDMSDNANKMGTSIESLQNAYQGFAKGNFTMLDNLKLGYGGTRGEMQRLIDDANKVKKANGEMANLSINSFADMVDAIHTIQTEMGITGTTAKEADSTILGSVNSMKASWKNLLNAVADDNQDMSKAVDNFVDSAITAGKNIVPRIRTAIDGIKKLFNSLVKEVFPKLKREVPELKPLINAFEWLIDHKGLIMTALKAIIGAFAVTKIVEFATKVKDAYENIKNFATGSLATKIVTGVGLMVGALTLLAEAFSSETEEQKQFRIEMEKNNEILDENTSSWEKLQEARQESLNKGMSELSYYENLYNELKYITDENGKVQKGYEKRAEFITGELSKAFGIEIEYQNGVIKNNEKIMKTIDELIEKKRAEIIINSQADLYAEAKANEMEAYKNMKYYQKLMEDQTVFHTKEMEESYQKAIEQYNQYRFTIQQYEGNLAEYQAGHYDKLETQSWEYVKTLQESGNAEYQALEDKRNKAKYDYDLALKDYEKYGDERHKQQLESAKILLETEQKNLDNYIATIRNSRTGITEAGKYAVTGLSVGINSKSGDVYNSIKTLATNMLYNLKKTLKIASPSKEAIQISDYLMQGLELGIKKDTNSLLNQVDELGNSIIGNLYSSTQTAMNGLGGLMSSSLNPTINPNISYDLNYRLMANAMKEALREVEVELDDRQVGRFIDKTISEEVFN